MKNNDLLKHLCLNGREITSEDRRFNTRELLNVTKHTHFGEIDDMKDITTEYERDFRRMMPQVEGVVKKLKEQPLSRQCVIVNWKVEDLTNPVPPCLMSVQFLIRQGQLHAFYYIRSSDVPIKLKDDLRFCKFIAQHVLENLEREYPNLQLGTLTYHLGSAHMYLS